MSHYPIVALPQIRQDNANGGVARMALFGRICRPG